jgi:hypothetical protein
VAKKLLLRRQWEALKGVVFYDKDRRRGAIWVKGGC